MKSFIKNRLLVGLLKEGSVYGPSPEYYYHGTYNAWLPSIKKFGLSPEHSKPVWDFSKEGVVYLTDDYWDAEAYAENADEVSDEVHDSGIVVLKVTGSKISPDKIHLDKNQSEGNTNEYHGIIPWEAIEVANESEELENTNLGADTNLEEAGGSHSDAKEMKKAIRWIQDNLEGIEIYDVKDGQKVCPPEHLQIQHNQPVECYTLHRGGKGRFDLYRFLAKSYGISKKDIENGVISNRPLSSSSSSSSSGRRGADNASQQKREPYKKIKLPSGKVVRYFEGSNRFETDNGTELRLDDIFDSLPETLQNFVLNKMG